MISCCKHQPCCNLWCDTGKWRDMLSYCMHVNPQDMLINLWLYVSQSQCASLLWDIHKHRHAGTHTNTQTQWPKCSSALLKLCENDLVGRRWPFNIWCCFEIPQNSDSLTVLLRFLQSGQSFQSVYFWPSATSRMRLDKKTGLSPVVTATWRLALRSLAKWLIPPGKNPCSTSLFGPRLSPLQQG